MHAPILAVQVVHHEAKNVSDRFARSLVKMARYGFDLVTGYKHASPDAALKTAAARGQTNLSLEEMRKMGLVMDPKQWLSVRGLCFYSMF